MKTTEKARFDTRLPKAQKDFFEYAAALGGFRTLTEFVIVTVQERANEITEAHHKVLATQRDQAIFFNEVVHPSPPNEALKAAAQRYHDATTSF